MEIFLPLLSLHLKKNDDECMRYGINVQERAVCSHGVCMCSISAKNIHGSIFQMKEPWVSYEAKTKLYELRGPLSLMSTIEELLGRSNSGLGLESREYGRRDPSR
jgi:hypothetical protein